MNPRAKRAIGALGNWAATLEPKFLAIGKPLFYTNLQNGESVSIIARETEFDASIIPSSERFDAAGARLLDRSASGRIPTRHGANSNSPSFSFPGLLRNFST
jgi:hypothetical protein